MRKKVFHCPSDKSRTGHPWNEKCTFDAMGNSYAYNRIGYTGEGGLAGFKLSQIKNFSITVLVADGNNRTSYRYSTEPKMA